MRAHSRGLVRDATLTKRHGSGLQTAFGEKTDFFSLTNLPWAILQGGRNADKRDATIPRRT
eukprot:5475313-Prymnesium_polylepis.1